MSSHNIELRYEFVKSKQSYMWLYVDTSYFSHYSYIYKTYDKPSKREFRKRKQWCLEQVKFWKYWEEI
jgi:hypothetical protein